MKASDGNIIPAAGPSDVKDELTGLPGLHTWRGVYLFVFGSFVVWVALLLALTMGYQ